MTLTAETSSGSKLSAIIRLLSRQTGDGLTARFAKLLFNEVDEAEFEAYGASVANTLSDMLSGRAFTLAKLTVGVAQLRDLAAA